MWMWCIFFSETNCGFICRSQLPRKRKRSIGHGQRSRTSASRNWWNLVAWNLCALRITTVFMTEPEHRKNTWLICLVCLLGKCIRFMVVVFSETGKSNAYCTCSQIAIKVCSPWKRRTFYTWWLRIADSSQARTPKNGKLLDGTRLNRPSSRASVHVTTLGQDL